MRQAIEKEWKRRLNAINYLRSGWMAAMGILAHAIGKEVGKNVARSVSKFGEHGGASPAKTGFTPTASFFNTAFSEIGGDKAVPISEKGLKEAMDVVLRDMEKHTANRMQQRANKYAARLFR